MDPFSSQFSRETQDYLASLPLCTCFEDACDISEVTQGSFISLNFFFFGNKKTLFIFLTNPFFFFLFSFFFLDPHLFVEVTPKYSKFYRYEHNSWDLGLYHFHSPYNPIQFFLPNFVIPDFSFFLSCSCLFFFSTFSSLFVKICFSFLFLVGASFPFLFLFFLFF